MGESSKPLSQIENIDGDDIFDNSVTVELQDEEASSREGVGMGNHVGAITGTAWTRRILIEERL